MSFLTSLSVALICLSQFDSRFILLVQSAFHVPPSLSSPPRPPSAVQYSLFTCVSVRTIQYSICPSFPSFVYLFAYHPRLSASRSLPSPPSMPHPSLYLLVRPIQYLQTGRSGEVRQNRVVWRGYRVTEAWRERQGEREGWGGLGGRVGSVGGKE